MNRIALAATSGAVALALILSSCSSSAKSTSASSGSVGAASSSTTATVANAPVYGKATTPASGITISGFAYSGTLTVKAGATVTVTNKDSAAHTLTDKVAKKFDTGNIPGNGGVGTFTAPSIPGSYPFGCTYHPNMAGTLVVTP